MESSELGAEEWPEEGWGVHGGRKTLLHPRKLLLIVLLCSQKVFLWVKMCMTIRAPAKFSC